MKMADQVERVINERLPLIHMEPKMDFTPPVEDYTCPLYKTALRAGVLSTTGKQYFICTILTVCCLHQTRY